MTALELTGLGQDLVSIVRAPVPIWFHAQGLGLKVYLPPSWSIHLRTVRGPRRSTPPAAFITRPYTPSEFLMREVPL